MIVLTTIISVAILLVVFVLRPLLKFEALIEREGIKNDYHPCYYHHERVRKNLW
jgi:hypothetical protein